MRRPDTNRQAGRGHDLLDVISRHGHGATGCLRKWLLALSHIHNLWVSTAVMHESRNAGLKNTTLHSSSGTMSKVTGQCDPGALHPPRPEQRSGSRPDRVRSSRKKVKPMGCDGLKCTRPGWGGGRGEQTLAKSQKANKQNKTVSKSRKNQSHRNRAGPQGTVWVAPHSAHMAVTPTPDRAWAKN